MFPDAGARLKAITHFVKNGKGKKAAVAGEVSAREQQLSVGIVDLDPFSGIDREMVKKIAREEEERE